MTWFMLFLGYSLSLLQYYSFISNYILNSLLFIYFFRLYIFLSMSRFSSVLSLTPFLHSLYPFLFFTFSFCFPIRIYIFKDFLPLSHIFPNPPFYNISLFSFINFSFHLFLFSSSFLPCTFLPSTIHY